MKEYPQVYLIDASIYIFQAHFSSFVESYDTDGEELSALFGFIQFLLQFIRRNKPTHIAVAHDQSLFCGFRHTLYPDYKSNRELPDENLAMQLNGCVEICSILGLETFASKIYEADDIIGTVAKCVRISNPAAQIVIVSRDKDLAQLLKSEEDYLWDYNGNRKRYIRDVKEEFGVHPGQFPDYLGLIGDPVDCIPGVSGVGPVKARILLKEFKTIEEIYLNLERVGNLEIRGSKGLMKALIGNKSRAELSKKLATIVCDVSNEDEYFGSISFKKLELNRPDKDKFLYFLDQYRFRSSDKDRLLKLLNYLDRV